MTQAADALKLLVQQANALEGDIATAKKVVDDFFVDGDGAEFTDESDLQSVRSDLGDIKRYLRVTNRLLALPRAWSTTSSPPAQARLSMMKPKWIKLLLTCVSLQRMR